MRTLHRPSDRADMLARVRQIAPDATPAWGRFTAPRMVTHITDALRMGVGTLPVASRRTPLRFSPLKELFVYLLPIPKGLPTAPALVARAPAGWTDELDAFAAQLDAFGRYPQAGPWPVHPAFGALSRRAWGVLTYRHLDHHLRQFGVQGAHHGQV